MTTVTTGVSDLQARPQEHRVPVRPGTNSTNDLVRRVFLDVVTSAPQHDGMAPGERCLEALSLLGAEGDVPVAPHDQGGQFAEESKPIPGKERVARSPDDERRHPHLGQDAGHRRVALGKVAKATRRRWSGSTEPDPGHRGIACLPTGDGFPGPESQQ